MTRPGATDSGLASRAVAGAKWRFASTAISAALQFGIGAVLARLLTPQDFGLVALAQLVVGMTGLFRDLGIATALVQRPHLSNRHIRSAFTISVLFGCALAGLVAITAPGAGALVAEPRVTPIIQVLAITFALHGVSLVSGAQLRRKFDFKRLFVIEVGSYSIAYAGVGVSLAFLGYGVWSLVWSALLQAALNAVIQFAMSRHDIRPLISRRELRELLGFGLGATAGGLVNFVARNGDNFIVGRYLGVIDLGFYGRAYNLMMIPQTYASSTISAVLLPAFAQVQSDAERLRRGFLMATELTGMIAGPVMAGMIVAAPHLIVTLYGTQWTESVVPLQILCGVGYFRALYHLGGITLYSAGRVYSDLWRQLVYAALVLIGAFAGSRYGIVGVAIATSLAVAYMYVATAQLALSVTATPARAYLRVQVGPFLVSIATFAVASAVRVVCNLLGVPSVLSLIIIVIACGITCGIGFLWKLGDPSYLPLLQRLPTVSTWMVRTVRIGVSGGSI